MFYTFQPSKLRDEPNSSTRGRAMLFMSSRVQHSVRGIIDYILVFDYINWLDLWSFTVFQIEHNSPDTPNLPGRFYLSHESRPSQISNQAVQLQYVKEKQCRKPSQQHVHVLTTRDPQAFANHSCIACSPAGDLGKDLCNNSSTS